MREGAMRLDVREQTRCAAVAERDYHDTYLVLMSGDLAREWSDWSRPVQLKAEIGEDGLVELTVRNV